MAALNVASRQRRCQGTRRYFTTRRSCLPFDDQVVSGLSPTEARSFPLTIKDCGPHRMLALHGKSSDRR